MDSDAPVPSRPFQWAAVALGAFVFVLVAIEVWHSHSPTGWERPIITAVDRMPMPLRDVWTGAFEPIPFALMTVALGFAAAKRGRISLGVAGVTGCLAAVVAAELVFKPMIDRVRLHTYGLRHHVERFGGAMFPSAHVTAAASLAMFAWLVLDRGSRLRPLLIALPFVVGWAVVAKHMHYPADVAAGLVLGPTVVYCTAGALDFARRLDTRLRTEPDARRTVDATL